TVEGWRTFYARLKPGGIVGFSRWNAGAEASQTYRLFALAFATLLSEHGAHPGDPLALVACRGVSTLVLSNQPLTPADLAAVRSRAEERGDAVVYLTRQTTTDRTFETT